MSATTTSPLDALATDLVLLGWAIDKRAEIASGWWEFMATITDRPMVCRYTYRLHIDIAHGEMGCRVGMVAHTDLGDVPQATIDVLDEPFRSALEVVRRYDVRQPAAPAPAVGGGQG